MIKIYNLLYLILLFDGFASQQMRKPCYHELMQRPGICQPVSNCRSAIYELRQYKMNPQNCGTFLGTIPIVCCSSGDSEIGYISNDRCDDYSNFAYKWEEPGILLPGAAPERRSTCPFDDKPMIVGGEEAQAKEFPHMASLGINKEGKIQWLCGGSLISELFVLTAAHCINTEIRQGIVRLGDLVLSSSDDDARAADYKIAEAIKYPEYSYRSHYHDIALLKLNRWVQFNEYIRPLCLYTKQTITETHAVASGWGVTETDLPSDSLRKVTLEIFTHDTCKSSYSSRMGRRIRDGILQDSQFCAGSFNSDKDTCNGDSGGPLQVHHPEKHCMYQIIGITSFGVNCAKGIPGIYTKVSNYISWIEDTVWLGKAPKLAGRSHEEL